MSYMISKTVLKTYFTKICFLCFFILMLSLSDSYFKFHSTNSVKQYHIVYVPYFMGFTGDHLTSKTICSSLSILVSIFKSLSTNSAIYTVEHYKIVFLVNFGRLPQI